MGQPRRRGGRARRSAAARMTRRVGADAGPQDLLEHGLVDEHARARRRRGSRPPRPPAAAPSRAGGRRGRRRPGRVAAAPGRAAARRVPMPTDVALTTTSAPRIVVGDADPARRRPARPPRGARRRPVDDDDLAGTGAPERVDDAARRGAGARRPRPRRPRDGRRPTRPATSTKPSPSVLCPTSRPSSTADDRVDRPQRGRRRAPARRPPRRRPPCAASSPTARRCRACASRPARPPAAPGATSNATYVQSSPPAANAALCSAGDSECPTGWPMTAATARRLSRTPAAMRGLDVGVVLLAASPRRRGCPSSSAST